LPEIAASFIFSAVVKSLEDNPLPFSLSTLLDKPAVTSDAFALVASCVVVAYPLRSWSPVLVPEIASSLFFSAVE
jgi:hypothetical protein